jgi:hypothetical protein
VGPSPLDPPGAGHHGAVRGVYTYRSNGEGKPAALRAFWPYDAVELADD